MTTSPEEMAELTTLYAEAYEDNIIIWENMGMAAAISAKLWDKLEANGLEKITDLTLGDLALRLPAVPGNGGTRPARVRSAINEYKKSRAENPEIDWDGDKLTFPPPQS